MDGQNTFTFTHRLYYEPLNVYAAQPAFEARLRTLLPESWAFRRDGPWLHVQPRRVQRSAQGFKIHVSSAVEHAADVMSAVVPVCAGAGVSFKLAADEALLSLMNSKGLHARRRRQIHHDLPHIG